MLELDCPTSRLDKLNRQEAKLCPSALLQPPRPCAHSASRNSPEEVLCSFWDNVSAHYFPAPSLSLLQLTLRQSGRSPPVSSGHALAAHQPPEQQSELWPGQLQTQSRVKSLLKPKYSESLEADHLQNIVCGVALHLQLSRLEGQDSRLSPQQRREMSAAQALLERRLKSSSLPRNLQSLNQQLVTALNKLAERTTPQVQQNLKTRGTEAFDQLAGEEQSLESKLSSLERTNSRALSKLQNKVRAAEGRSTVGHEALVKRFLEILRKEVQDKQMADSISSFQALKASARRSGANTLAHFQPALNRQPLKCNYEQLQQWNKYRENSLFSVYTVAHKCRLQLMSFYEPVAQNITARPEHSLGKSRDVFQLSRSMVGRPPTGQQTFYCHQCRLLFLQGSVKQCARSSNHLQPSRKHHVEAANRGCGRYFCSGCIRTFYPSFLSEGACPFCMQQCNCARCQRTHILSRLEQCIKHEADEKAGRLPPKDMASQTDDSLDHSHQLQQLGKRRRAPSQAHAQQPSPRKVSRRQQHKL